MFDVIGWALIKHPWRLSIKEFYIDYQPWISLIYLAIFLSPVMEFLIRGLKYLKALYYLFLEEGVSSGMKSGQAFRRTIIHSSTMLLKKCDTNGKNLH